MHRRGMNSLTDGARAERLTPERAAEYRELMLHAYADHPDAFTSSVAERGAMPLSWWGKRLAPDPEASERVYGAIVDGRLAGAVGLSFEPREKARHKALLFGMYVPQRSRNQGLGAMLVRAALEGARERPEVKLVQLTVTDVNHAARALYEKHGFVAFGTEPFAVAVDGAYVAKLHMSCALDPAFAAPPAPAGFLAHAHVMADYNAWMNGKLYEAAAALSDAQRKADQGAFFKSIHGTLNHVLLADRVWLARFGGPAFAARPLDTELYGEFAELRRERAATDAAIEAWVAGATGERLAGILSYTSITAPRPRTMPLWMAVAHFFNHQTHHRGQVTTLIKQQGVDPGVTDLMWSPAVQAAAT